MANDLQAIRDEIVQLSLHLNVDQPTPICTSATDASRHEFFTGHADENFDLWLDRLNRLVQANNWDAAQKRLMVPTFFRDFAETAYNSIPLATRTGLTFDQLTDMLRQRFVPEDSADFYG